MFNEFVRNGNHNGISNTFHTEKSLFTPEPRTQTTTYQWSQAPQTIVIVDCIRAHKMLNRIVMASG